MSTVHFQDRLSVAVSLRGSNGVEGAGTPGDPDIVGYTPAIAACAADFHRSRA